MSDKTTSTTHIKCEFCGKTVKSTYLKKHYKSQFCTDAREDTVPLEANQLQEIPVPPSDVEDLVTQYAEVAEPTIKN
jgi:hypothetical protein